MTQPTHLTSTGPFVSLAVDKVMRRTLGGAAALAVGGVVVGAVIGYPMFGVGVAVGLTLGVINVIGMRRMVNRLAADGVPSKRATAGASLSRLGVVTLAVFVLAFLDKQVAFGALGGLVVFQAVFLANSSRILMAQIRRDAGP